MSESEMKAVSSHQPSPSRSPSTPPHQPPSQVHSISPEIYARYPPKLARRMQAGSCFSCKQKGHWSWDCPLKSPNAKSLSPSPSPKDHGSCGCRVSEDELLKNKSIVPIRKSTQRTLNDFWEDFQHDKTDNDIVKGGYLLVEHSKRMRIMDNSERNSENHSLMAVSELAEKEEAAPSAAPSKGVGSQEFEVADNLQNPDLSWDASIKEQSWLLSRPSTTSRICYQKDVFERHIFAGVVADASFGSVSPSFNPIGVSKQVSIGDGPCESSQLADNSLSQQPQISTGCDTEVSRDAITPNKSPASERKPMSKAERRRQVVLFAQKKLLIDLETFNPNEHESMREAAEATFDMLDNLGVNYKQFSEHVWDYINLASSMAEMDKSMENSLNLDEYNKRSEEEKVRFARVQDDCFNTETLLEASNQRRQSLIEEISHLEAMLCEKQTQLKSCELENLQMETHLGELRISLMEADTTLKVIAEEAKTARQLNEERQAKQISARTTLEKAKRELEN